MTEIVVNGEALVATTAGALYWPARETLIVSDLHFEKGSHFATKGVLLPPYDTRTTLKRLAVLMKSFAPASVISLGDAFHDGGAEARMDEDDAALLAALASSVRWFWMLGNHDPAPPKRFPGDVERSVRLGRLLFRHEPAAGPAPGEIAGHLHPAARVRAESRTMRGRCFATDGERLVMPAFGAFAGGLNVLDPAFFRVLPRPTAFLLGATGVYPYRGAALLEDPGEDALPAFRRGG
jgi:DNA ligase-associated metallophosphoesterase